MKTYWGSGGIASRILWPRHYMEVNGQFHAPAALPPGKVPPGTHWIGGWVGPRTGLDMVLKRKVSVTSQMDLKYETGIYYKLKTLILKLKSWNLILWYFWTEFYFYFNKFNVILTNSCSKQNNIHRIPEYRKQTYTAWWPQWSRNVARVITQLQQQWKTMRTENESRILNLIHIHQYAAI